MYELVIKSIVDYRRLAAASVVNDRVDCSTVLMRSGGRRCHKVRVSRSVGGVVAAVAERPTTTDPCREMTTMMAVDRQITAPNTDQLQHRRWQHDNAIGRVINTSLPYAGRHAGHRHRQCVDSARFQTERSRPQTRHWRCQYRRMKWSQELDQTDNLFVTFEIKITNTYRLSAYIIVRQTVNKTGGWMNKLAT